MLLYEPDRKSDSLSMRSTATSMSTMPRYILYDPDDLLELSASQRRPPPTAPLGHHHGTPYTIEVRESGAVVAAVATSKPIRSPYYFDKRSLLEDPYDAQGIRQGAWEVALCDPRACLPMACGVPLAVPSVALAQVRTRLGLTQYYGAALAHEFARLLALVALPFAAYFSLEKLQHAPAATPGTPADAQMEATAWMVLLWAAFLAEVIVGLVTVLALSDLRFKIRTRFQIPGSRAQDLCVAACAPSCAVAQMSTHVRCLRPGRYALARPETLPPYEY